MTEIFIPEGRALLIGSLPIRDHEAAVEWVFTYTPDIPVWVQLPAFPQEGMVPQFLPGMPGVVREGDKTFLDPDTPEFPEAQLAFYEEYMAVAEAGADLNTSRFALTPETAPGFFALERRLRALAPESLPAAVKGQVTGPFTFSTVLKDRAGRAVFYDEQHRDAAVKLIALKARWQARRLAAFGRPVIIFMDEPALAGFGSSEFISISREDITACLGEVIEAIHAEGGLAGIHVCANTEWDMVMSAGVDIVNFDAYAYAERFGLYDRHIRDFLDRGGLVAWGIIPTLLAENIRDESADSLFVRWTAEIDRLAAKGIDPSQLRRQSIISPSCGTGSISEELALKVLAMTRDLSAKVRGLA